MGKKQIKPSTMKSFEYPMYPSLQQLYDVWFTTISAAHKDTSYPIVFIWESTTPRQKRTNPDYTFRTGENIDVKIKWDQQLTDDQIRSIISGREMVYSTKHQTIDIAPEFLRYVQNYNPLYYTSRVPCGIATRMPALL